MHDYVGSCMAICIQLYFSLTLGLIHNTSKIIHVHLQDLLNQQEMLGSGRYGEMYTFRHHRKFCAGKIIHKKLLPGYPHTSSDQIDDLKENFEVYSAYFENCQHSNVEVFYSLQQLTPNSPIILLTELLHENLNTYTARMRGNLSIKEQINLCYDMAKGLQFLHNTGVVHNNLHGANVLISEDGRAKIADYICPQIASLNDNTAPQYNVYMSPESITNTKPVTQQSDIYSLGVLWLQVATQYPPLPDNSLEVFEAQRWKEQMNQIIDNPLQPLIAQCFNPLAACRPCIDDICSNIHHLEVHNYISTVVKIIYFCHISRIIGKSNILAKHYLWDLKLAVLSFIWKEPILAA